MDVTTGNGRAGRIVPAAVSIVLVWAMIVYWPSLSALAALWSDPERRTYQHGYLVAGIALWIIFRRRENLAQVSRSPSPVWLAAATAASLAWGIAVLAGLQTVHVLLWPAVAWLALTGAMGWRAGRLLLFPFGYLYFAMPLWDPLAAVLQSVTVAANHVLTSMAGIPALIEGATVHIPAGSFEISGRCSGLNYFIAGLALAALLGEMNDDRLSRRLLLVIIVAILAMVSNWLRVFIVVVAGHLSGMQHYLVRVEHQNLGWILFALTLAGFFAVVRRLPGPKQASSDGNRATDAPAVSAGMRPGMLLLALSAMAVGPALAHVSGAREIPGAMSIMAPQWPTWQRAQVEPGAWAPVVPGADGEFRADYSRDGDRVGVYVASFLRQEQSREIVGHGTSLAGSDDAALLGSVHTRRVTTGVSEIPVADREWSDGRSQAVLWWTYRIGERDFASGLPAQLWYGLNSLWSQPVSTVAALRAECVPDCDRARQLLQDFAAEGLSALLAAPTPEQ